MAETIRLTWHHGFLEPQDGAVQVEGSRQSVSEAISRVLPRVDCQPKRLVFVPLGGGRTQVNVQGFGPFGVLERDQPP